MAMEMKRLFFCEDGLDYTAHFWNNYWRPEFTVERSDGAKTIVSFLEPKYIHGEFKLSSKGREALNALMRSEVSGNTDAGKSAAHVTTFWEQVAEEVFNDAATGWNFFDYYGRTIPDYTLLPLDDHIIQIHGYDVDTHCDLGHLERFVSDLCPILALISDDETFVAGGVRYWLLTYQDEYEKGELHVWGEDGTHCDLSVNEPRYTGGDLRLSAEAKELLSQCLERETPLSTPEDPETWWDFVASVFEVNSPGTVWAKTIPDYRLLP